MKIQKKYENVFLKNKRRHPRWREKCESVCASGVTMFQEWFINSISTGGSQLKDKSWRMLFRNTCHMEHVKG